MNLSAREIAACDATAYKGSSAVATALSRSDCSPSDRRRDPIPATRGPSNFGQWSRLTLGL
jgi:hypothetical protein